jgi:hypothetical protein
MIPRPSVNCLSWEREIDNSPDHRLLEDPAALIVRMVPWARAKHVRGSPGTFGFTFFPNDGRFATVADVFGYDTEELANTRGVPVPILLGYVVANELGHLLLGPASHGIIGIMQCPWRPEEMKNIARGFMMFTPEEAEKMRRNIQTRVNKETSSLFMPQRFCRTACNP